jgi:hypothetical protein
MLTKDIVQEADLGSPPSLVGTHLPLREHERLSGVEAAVDGREATVGRGDREDAGEAEKIEGRAAGLHDELVGGDEEGGLAEVRDRVG